MELRSGYKETEVGPLPLDWDDLQVGYVCRLVNGRGFKPHEWRSNGLPIIRIQNLNGSGDFNYFAGQYDPKIFVQHGQLLFAWSGSRGTSFGPHVWNGGNALLNYHTWKVVTDDAKVRPDFFFHALRHLTGYIEDKAHGASALVHTQKWEMEKFRVAIPRFQPEQRAIAEALGDVDALLGALDRLIAKKRDLKQAALQQLLTGQTRLPGFSGAWEVKRLGEVADTDPENLNGHTKPDFAFNYISLEDVDGGFLRSHSKQIFSGAPSRARRKLRPNDVLVSTVRPNLQSHLLFRIDSGEWVCSTGFCVVRCRPAIIHPGYVFFHLFAHCVNKQIETLLTGSNYPAINGADVRALKIPFPIYEEQRAIAAVLSDMDAEVEALKLRHAKTAALKQGMMQELLSGRTRLV
jgi:type I restriction enzyme S subunit